MLMIPGRGCPLSYRYVPEALSRAPDLVAETLYIAGGLYGNEQALETVLEFREADADSTLIFNGDFNWFNVDPAGFVRTNRLVLKHSATRGNVETEIAADSDEAGCGCGYPQWVGDAEVERSNAIMARLRATAREAPGLRAVLGALPSFVVAEVSGIRVAIVHGDLESLAGWDLAQEHIDDDSNQARIAARMARARLRIVASSHTCLPVVLPIRDGSDHAVVINNGAAGMPNFKGTRFGVITRISVRPAPRIAPLYSLRVGAVHVEALPVHYAHDRFLRAFRANWPEESAAYASYYRRIVSGPEYAQDRAVRAAHVATRRRGGT